MSEGFEFFENEEEEKAEISKVSFPSSLSDCCGLDLTAVLGKIPGKLPLITDKSDSNPCEDIMLENSFMIKRPKLESDQISVRQQKLPWVREYQKRQNVGRQAHTTANTTTSSTETSVNSNICPNTGVNTSMAKRKQRIQRGKSAFTSEEHATFRTKKIPRELIPILIKERQEYQNRLVRRSTSCVVCNSSSAASHTHINQAWLLPHVRTCFLKRLPTGDRPLPPTKLLSTFKRNKTQKHAVHLQKHIGNFGEVCEFKMCSTVPDSVPHQIDVRVSPFTNVEYIEKTSASGIEADYLHFPARSTDGGMSRVNGTAGHRKKTAAEMEWTCKEKVSKEYFKKKENSVELVDDGVIAKHLLGDDDIKIVCSPSTAAKIAENKFSQHGISMVIESKMIGGRYVLFIGKPQKAGYVAPRCVNENFFKNALLTDGCKTDSVQFQVAEQNLDDEWDPAALPETPSTDKSKFQNFSYGTYSCGGVSVLFRSKIHCLHNDVPTTVRANMEYNCAQDPLLIPDDCRTILHERLSESAYISLYCGLCFRDSSCKTLLGRVNAFTSSVIGWEEFTLKQLEGEGYKYRTVANDDIKSSIGSVFNFIKNNISETGSYLLKLPCNSDEVTLSSFQAPPPNDVSLCEVSIDNRSSSSVCIDSYQPPTAWFYDRNLPLTYPHPNKYNLSDQFPEYPDETIALSRILIHDGNTCKEVK